MNTTQAPTTISRWKWTLTTLDDKERYLSQMCAQGWAPVSLTCDVLFRFARTEPGEYVCASAATVKMSGASAGSFDRQKYSELAALLEAQGAWVVPQGASLDGREGIIAVRRADQGPFLINSDAASRIEDLRARIRFRATLAFMYLCLAASFFSLTFAFDTTMTVGSTAYLVAGICFLGAAAEYGWPARKYLAAIKRLERERELFE